MEACALQKLTKMAMRIFRRLPEDERMTEKKKDSEDEENEFDRFVFLTDDILSDILKRLPDAFLHYKAKYVCIQWFDIITKRILLDYASFILQHSSVRLVGIREEEQGLQVKEQNLDIPFRGLIMSWYKEFLLILDRSSEKSLYVFNLITKERSFLPDCHTSCLYKYCPLFKTCVTTCALALFFDRFKGVYKVVHLDMNFPLQCHILILGRDIVSGVCSASWEKMEVASDMEESQHHFYDYALSVQVQGRYFHGNVHSSKYLVSVDMVKEQAFQTSLPGYHYRISGCYSVIEMGGFLTLIDGVYMGRLEIWILQDFEKMRWEKLQSITVPDYFVGTYLGTRSQYRVCGMISKRYIIFRSKNGMFSYDLKIGVLEELNIHMQSGHHNMVPSSAPSFI